MAKGWTSPSTSVRRSFDYNVDITKPSGPDNREVHSKNTRRYRRNETTGRQPGELYVDPVNGDSPITHHNEPFVRHQETVGHDPVTGEHRHPTFPNAERKAAGNSVRTHAPLEPVGQTHSKYGGAHGEPQKRPESNRGRAASAPLGTLNRTRSR